MANLITTIRIVLGIFALSIIKISAVYNFMAVGIIVVCMLLDALDGYFARLLNASSLVGSVYDILADRMIENLFFIYFATQSLFSVWIAIFFTIRGLTLDAIRSLFLSIGKTAFGPKSIHSEPWAKVLTGSRTSRACYNAGKMLTFSGYALLTFPQAGYLNSFISFFAPICLWLTVLVASLRSIPVLYEALAIFILTSSSRGLSTGTTQMTSSLAPATTQSQEDAEALYR